MYVCWSFRGNNIYSRQWNDDDGSDFIYDDQYFQIERPLSYEQPGHGNRNRIPGGPEHHFQPQNGKSLCIDLFPHLMTMFACRECLFI